MRWVTFLFCAAVPLALGACQSQSSTPAIVQTSTAPTASTPSNQNAAANLSALNERAKVLSDENRKRRGLPPESDFVSNVMMCDNRVRAGQQKFMACAETGYTTVGILSTEAANVTADGIIAMCRPIAAEWISTIVWDYCLPTRDRAEEAVGLFVGKVRERILGKIVTKRAADSVRPPLSAPLPITPKKPDETPI